MSKHTRGPWEVKPEEDGVDYVRVRGTRLGYLYRICNVILPTRKECRAQWEIDERRANARLIAAAPELLEALIDAQEKLCDLPLMDPIVLKMRAAIAKATGETT